MMPKPMAYALIICISIPWTIATAPLRIYKWTQRNKKD
jgi:hypothetical protein